MKALSLVVGLVLIASSAFAAGDFGIEAGIRQQSGDSDAANTTGKSEMGFQFGGVAAFQVNGPLYIRTGMLYTQRPLTLNSTVAFGVNEYKVTMNYVDIPVALMYKFEDYAGVFAGVSLAMNLDASTSNGGGKIEDIKSPYIPLLLGATFKFAPQLGGTIYFETGNGDVAKGLKNYRAVGANLLITFE